MPHQDDTLTLELPEWIAEYGSELKTLGAAVKEHGSLRNAVVYFVATWIVGGILTMGRTVVDSILLAFDAVVNAFELTSKSIIMALDAVGVPILEAASGVPAFFAGLVEPFGPLAPFVGVVTLVAIFVVTYRLLKAILLEIPILGGFLEFLGADL